MSMKPVAVMLFVAFLGITTSIAAGTLSIGDTAPKISGSEWINSPPLSAKDLNGHVVLVEFWTYG
jgi:hypothetical protein